MKPTQAWFAFVGMYLFCSLASVMGVPINLDGWTFGTRPHTASIAIVAVSAACAAQGVATCLAAGVASQLFLVVDSFTARGTGQRGGGRLPISNRNVKPPQIWHDLGDGNVRDYLDTSALKSGVEHAIWDSEGNIFTATKHPQSNDNVLTIHFNSKLEDTPSGKRVIKGPKLDARQTNTEVDSFAASWSYSGTAYDDYGKDAANADADKVIYDMFGGQNREELLAPYDCTTLKPSNGDDESANISITAQGSGLSQEIQPACGA